MTAIGRELLTRLLALTPMPTGDSSAEQLLATFESILVQRAEIMAQIVPPITLSEFDRPLLIELERRQNIWQDTLAAALRVVGKQRCSASPPAHADPR